jgi:iron complex transport system ATP-binding protein
VSAHGAMAPLSVHTLSATYGPRPALHGVSLEVRPGELVGLTGPNGSGKSTLFKAALGLLAPSGGSVELGGSPVETLSIRERARRVAWMPQDEAPQENVPIFDYVLFGRYARLPPFEGESAEDHRQAEAALRNVDMWPRRGEGVLEVSGGERQRVLLARALAQETPLLLLDEPTTHLDIGHQLDLLERVRDLCHRTGRSAVAALHDLNLAARFSDRVVVLSRGRLVEDGPPGSVLAPRVLREVWGIVAEIRQDPKSGHPYLIPTLPAPDSLPRRPGRGPVHVVGGGGSAGPLLRQLVDAGWDTTVGVLALFDSDTEAAEELGVPSIVELPFAPMSAESRDRLRTMLAGAAAVVVASIPVGPGNLANLEELVDGAARRPTLLLEPTGWEGRDFTGGSASRVREELLARGAQTVGSIRDALGALDRLLPRGAVRATGPTAVAAVADV